MNLRLETKPAFYVSGYPMETSEATLAQDCATLREQHEETLRAVSNHLYFASFMGKEDTMTYLLGIATTSLSPATEGATCIEIPATRFAIATVPAGAPILATWHTFFETGIPSLNAEIDMDYPFYFESFDENGACELWIPVKE